MISASHDQDTVHSRTSELLNREVDHWLVEYWEEMLVSNLGERIEARTRATSKNDSPHGGRRVEVLEPFHDETRWKIHLAETGGLTQTGGRIHRVARYLEGDEFMVTYGDGVADIDITALLEFHRKTGKLATVTGVRPPS